MPIKRGYPEEYFFRQIQNAPGPQALYEDENVRVRYVPHQINDSTSTNSGDNFKVLVFAGIVIVVCFLGYLVYMAKDKK